MSRCIPSQKSKIKSMKTTYKLFFSVMLGVAIVLLINGCDQPADNDTD